VIAGGGNLAGLSLVPYMMTDRPALELSILDCCCVLQQVQARICYKRTVIDQVYSRVILGFLGRYSYRIDIEICIGIHQFVLLVFGQLPGSVGSSEPD
jgi:hypothetical protein